MPYVYEDPIMRGQNPFARPVPVSSGMRDMTSPMPTRPTGQATNTQGQSGIGPGGRPSVDFLPGVDRPQVSPEELTVRPGTDLVAEVSAPSDADRLQAQLQAVADREQASLQPVTAPEAGGSASPMLGTGGFEFIGLIAIGALIYYMARA